MFSVLKLWGIWLQRSVWEKHLPRVSGGGLLVKNAIDNRKKSTYFRRMKYGAAFFLFCFLLIQGFSQVHLTQTRVKWKKMRGSRMLKSVVCEIEDDNDALFRNWRKRAEDPHDWWFKYGEYSGPIRLEELDTHAYWQIDIGQVQVTAVETFTAEGALMGWRLSSRSDTLMLGNFRPGIIDPSLLSCSLGKLFIPDGSEESDFTLQKMLTFTQRKKGSAELEVFEAYSADHCPTEFRLVASFLATWVLARELATY